MVLRALALLIAVPMLAGDVRVWQSPDLDPAHYRTYELLPPKVLTKQGLIEGDPMIAPLIEKAVREQLAKKGLTEKSPGADMEVSTFAMAEKIPYVDMALFLPDWTITVGGPPVTLQNFFRQGTFAVNLIDPKVKHSIWMGIVTKALKSPSRRESDISKAAADVFKKYGE